MTTATDEKRQYRPMSESVKICLYGEWSTGKTEQIRWLAKTVGADKLLIVSAEGGLGTVKSLVESRPEMVVRVNRLGDLSEPFNPQTAAKLIAAGSPVALRHAWLTVKEFAADPSRWVVIDGGSEIMYWIANEQITAVEALFELKAVGQEPPDRLKPFGRFLGNNGSIQMPQVYGKIGRDIENLLAAWTALPCNLMVNFLEDMTGSTGFDKCKPYGPHVPGKVGLRAVMGSFDFVGRLMRRADGLTAGFRTTGEYLARVRADWEAGVKIPSEMPSFQLDRFLALLDGKNAD